MSACKVCGKMNCYAHGGTIGDDYVSRREEGINRPVKQNSGESHMGKSVRRGDSLGAHKVARGTIKEGRNLPKPKLQGLAHGGPVHEIEVGMDDDHDMEDIDNELNDMAAQELMDALEKKDKKAVLESIRALVMNCGGKV